MVRKGQAKECCSGGTCAEVSHGTKSQTLTVGTPNLKEGCIGSPTQNPSIDSHEHSHDQSHKKDGATTNRPNKNCCKATVETTAPKEICMSPTQIPSIHSHEHSHKKDVATQSCHSKEANPPHEKPNSVVIVRENGVVVDVYDVTGKGKSFIARDMNVSDGDGGTAKKVCFSSHKQNVDEFLTHCFDENGVHGVPEEGCFCGVDTPHLHAHVHDDKACQENGPKVANLANLASLTFYPVKEDEVLEDAESTSCAIPASDVLPNECNSKEVTRSMKEGGYSSSQFVGPSRHHIFKVQHENHYDMLVHSDKTGDIILKHDCDSCGDEDVHGTLHLVSERSWNGRGVQKDTKFKMNFYEVPKSPLKILDLLSNFFTLDTTNRVNIIRETFPSPPRRKIPSCCSAGHCTAPVTQPAKYPSCCDSDGTCTASHDEEAEAHNDTTPSHDEEAEAHAATTPSTGLLTEKNADQNPTMDSGRSSFFVSGICCSAEVPIINGILEALKGVEKVSINVPNKIVYVTHKFSLITASQIKCKLDWEGFSSRIEKDANAAQTKSHTTIMSNMSNYVESTFIISSLFGQDNATKVKEMLREKFSKEQVLHSETHIPSKTMKIDHDPRRVSASTLNTFLQESGFDTCVTADGQKEGIWSYIDDEDDIEENSVKLQWHIILSGVCWVVSMFHLIGGKWEYLKYTAFLSVVLGVPKIAMKALMAMRRRQFDTNCMMLFATVGAIALQEYSEAAAVAFLFSISDWLEALSTSRARNALSAIVQLRPERAQLMNPATGEFVFVPAVSVRIGSIVSVRTGDKIPCDGIVVEGESVVDESSLTGESRPVQKLRGSQVSGGTVNAGLSQLLIRTSSTTDDSAVARLIRLVEDAQANRSPTEKMIDNFAKRYTPVVVLLALCMCTFPWISGHETGREWTKIGLVTVVIACPCALIISTPVTYVAGLAAAAQRGIVVKGGAHLESLGRVGTIAFDKTGTLTEGNFKLLHLRTWGESTRVEALRCLHAMEAHASHPLAAAIISAAKAENATSPSSWNTTSLENLEGEGVTALINGERIYVGNLRLFNRLGLMNGVPKKELDTARGWMREGCTVGFMSVEGRGIICSYCVTDAVREEAREVIASFLKLGIDVNMLTGDNARAAMSIGQSLGLEERQIRSELLPHEKLELVEQFIADGGDATAKKSCSGRKKDLVLMCGDGVNDAPALAISDVGVAMGAGAALAMETADITLLDSNLHKLLKVVKLGKRTNRIIIENIIFSFLAKVVVMGFTFAGYSSLWAAIGSDVGAMLIVTANGMKLLPSKKSVRSGSGYDSHEVRGKDAPSVSFPVAIPNASLRVPDEENP